MIQLEGRLDYRGWQQSWTLATGDGDVNLFPMVHDLLRFWNGKPVEHDCHRHFLQISQRDSAPMALIYDPENGKTNPVINKVDGFGFSNLGYYMDEHLRWLSSRLVIVEVDNDSGFFRVDADPREAVYGVRFNDNNRCGVPDADAMRVCRPGTENACVFLAMSGDGWACEKFNGPTARYLLQRLNEGTMRARRIGNCAILGRKCPDGR